jgi:hypothetical protein
MVLRLIDEQVAAATVIFTFPDVGGLIGGEQIRCSTGNGPQDKVHSLEICWKLPLEGFSIKS